MKMEQDIDMMLQRANNRPLLMQQASRGRLRRTGLGLTGHARPTQSNGRDAEPSFAFAMLCGGPSRDESTRCAARDLCKLARSSLAHVLLFGHLFVASLRRQAGVRDVNRIPALNHDPSVFVEGLVLNLPCNNWLGQF